VTDQQGRRPIRCAQVVSGGDQVGNIGRKVGVGKIAFACTQSGEVESKDRDPMLAQAPGDAARRKDILGRR